MSTGKNFAFIGLNVMLSVLIMSVVTIYVLPPIIEDLNTSNGSKDMGIVLQSKYELYDERASINDSETTGSQLIPNTTMLITIQNQSRISAVFSGYTYLVISSLDAGHLIHYNISLIIEGVGHRDTYVRYRTTDHEVLTELSDFHIYMDFVTDPLPAGTYKVSVSWISHNDHDGVSYLTFNWDPEDPLRSLWVQELA
ncbi:MAG: hypothetical protein KAT16_06670 [Candidatus Heimdallarchaeota archaeon]|nr:hypothetical protein [Candidatus Heimdallarchaeota archaeon]